MPNIFKPKRSTTASSVPTTGNLSDGELAVNLTDRKIFVRNGASIVTVADALVDGDKGDITVSSSGASWTIDSGVVTNAKLANVSTATIKGRTTAGTGSPEDLTGTQATALLDTFTTSLKGLAPASGGGTANFLRADGTWAAPTTTVSGNLNVGIVTATSFVKSGGTSSQFLKADGSVDSNTYITSASVGNGTLSLGVSGTGLSGTASFTANQSGNTTFTITSNATSANTANAIVSRDGSGNFIAGIITATTFSGALSGNATSATTATSATSAGSVTNSVTFNNAGTGAASGTTFNGSSAVTISHNTIGASPLAGSTSLTTTGTVTSGTWSGSFGSVSGANLTNLTAGNLSGTIPSAVLGNSSLFVGTTSIALNRASASQSLTGVNIDGSSGSCTGNANTATTLATTRTIWGQNFNGSANVTGALSGATDITATGTIKGNQVIGGTGSAIGSAGLIVNGTTGDNDSQLIIKKPSQSSFGVLSWDGQVFLSANIYYENSAWVHSAPTSNTNNNMLVLAPGTGVQWYASNNSTGSWNVAGGTTLWNDSGVWQRSLSNTLTLNTSGTGLSGSTTYNNSGAATFTVTSNATSANTVSTIVARDASGNFSAGTITATLSGNATSATTATSATSAGSVTNSVTFNNGGAGAASGTTFNGSAAQTISHNTIGASPLAGSTSLTTTGTVTTGTWSGSFGAVSGANLTNLTAGNLSGTIPSGVLGNSVHFIGTTSIALNRASAAQSLTGVNIDGSSGSCTGNAATATNISNTGTVTLASATESNSIYVTAPAYTTDQPVKLLNFDWYGNLWSLGNIRSGSTPSNGFGVYSSGTERARFTTSGITIPGVYTSTIATGTAPLTVSSTTVVTNLNADLLDGQQGTYYTTAGNLTGTIPSAVLGNSSVFLGTTSVALNRGTGALSLAGVSIDGSSGSCTGNAATATTLQTARTINGVSFNGSANITVTANTPNTLTLATSGTGLSGSATFNGGSATTFTVTLASSSANTANNVVLRDASGNFSAGTITASLSGSSTSCSGNAATATTLQTTRTIWGQNFNGSANVTGALTGVTDITATGNVAVDGAFRAESSNSTERFDIYYNETTDSLDFDYLTA